MVWQPVPLIDSIYKILKQRKVLTKKKLIELVKKENPAATEPMVNKELMVLELNNKIYVTSIGKETWKIELVEER